MEGRGQENGCEVEVEGNVELPATKTWFKKNSLN
jgi:hypothetical protein